MGFLQKYNQFKYRYMISEGTIKSLIPIIQSDILNDYYGGKQYDQLTDSEKKQLQIDIDNECKNVQNTVEQWTSNKQYQSWIYDVLKNGDKNISEDYEVIEQCIKDFEQLCKRPDLTSEEKNIQNYKTFQDLQKFVLNFQNDHKLNNDIYSCFTQIYDNNSYKMYLIKDHQYDDCNKLFGGGEYFNTGWCVAKNQGMFDYYLHGTGSDQYNGYIVWINKSDNKPFALLHYKSKQFKDTSDSPIEYFSADIIDGLANLEDRIDYYKQHGEDQSDNDLYVYIKHIWQYQNPDKKDIGFYVAFETGAQYDSVNKVLDCCNKRFHFKDEWLDENGTFDFTVTNCTDNWHHMFSSCHNLKRLPEKFIIEDGVVDTTSMFKNCWCLVELPEKFTIPDTVINCSGMFDHCSNLISLPTNFKLGERVVWTRCMFQNCINLAFLPPQFKLTQYVTITEKMFYYCEWLKELPTGFNIPPSVSNCRSMFEGCKQLKSLPHGFTIPPNCIDTNVFLNCVSLR